MVLHRILQTWTTGSLYVLHTIPDRKADHQAVDMEMVADREERLLCSGLGAQRMGWSCSVNWRILHLGYFAIVHAIVAPRCRSRRSESTAHQASLEIWVLGCRLRAHPSRLLSRYPFLSPRCSYSPRATYPPSPVSYPALPRPTFQAAASPAAEMSPSQERSHTVPLWPIPSSAPFPSLPCVPQVLVQGSNRKRLKSRSALGLGLAS